MSGPRKRKHRGTSGCACLPPRPISAPASTRSPWHSTSFLRSRPRPAAEFSIAATGRDAERCSRVEDNLILESLHGNCSRKTAGRLCPWPFAWPTAFPWGWAAARRLPGGWRPSLWRSILAGLAGVPSGSSKRPACLGPSGQRRGLLAGRFCRPLPARAEPCMWLASFHRRSGGPLWSFPRSRCPPARRAPCFLKITPERTWWPIFSRSALLGLAFAQGAGRPAAHRHAGPHSPALPGADLPFAAAAAAAGGEQRHSGRGLERRRTGGSGHHRERRERSGGLGSDPQSTQELT